MVDRLIQQAVLQVLQPLIDPTFSQHSHGFRPGHRARDAVLAAQQYVQDEGWGHRFVRYADDCKLHGGVVGDRAEGTPQGLGYSLWLAKDGTVKRAMSTKALATFKQRIRQMTRRSGERSRYPTQTVAARHDHVSPTACTRSQ